MDEQWIRAAMLRHREQTAVRPEQFVGALCDDLERWAAPRFRVYLDTCYWIKLRECAQGRSRSASIHAVYVLLKRLVEQGKVVCPVSDAVILETMGATDETTRHATADIFEMLSGGLCLRTESERMKLELFDLLMSHTGRKQEHRTSRWVRPGAALGLIAPELPAMDEDFNALMAKVTVEWMWEQTFHDLARDEDSLDHASFAQQRASALNQSNEDYAHELKSRQQALQAELAGMVKFFDDDVVRMVMAARKVSGTDEEISSFRETMRKGLYNMCRLRPDYIAPRIPTLYVAATCHAYRRWDKQWKFNGHDLLDIHQAIAGLGYGQLMLTERPLAAFIQSAGLDRLLGVVVHHAEHDAKSYLESLG